MKAIPIRTIKCVIYILMLVGVVMCIFEPPDTVTKAGPPPPSIVGSRDTYGSK